MGNCCATKQGPTTYKPETSTMKRVIIIRKNKDNSSQALDDELKDEKMQAAGGRGHTQNRLTMLDPKDVSNANSVMSSTLVQDGTSLS